MENEKPTSDPRRSRGITRTLIPNASNDELPRRNRTKRTVLIIALALAATLLATSGAAFALGAGPFSHSTPLASPSRSAELTQSPTPSGTSTPSPTQEPGSGVPQSTVPVSCEALGSTPSIAVLVPAPHASDHSIYGPKYAALQQAGVLSCLWYSSSGSSSLSLDVATDAEAGRADIVAQKAAGAVSLGVGDGSAFACQRVTVGCRASAISGVYWLNLDYQAFTGSYSSAPTQMAQVAKALLAQLQQHPSPLKAWTMPSTSWAPVVGCAGLATSTSMADILSSPGMTGPNTINPGSMNGILQTQAESYDCYWSVLDSAATPDGQIRRLSVELAPGSAWAFDRNGTVVHVEGAQEARMDCRSAEAPQCSLNVLTDHSWMKLGAGDAIPPAQSQRLVAAAEAILAAHN